MRLFDDVRKTQLGSTVNIAPGQEAGIIRAYGPDQFAQMVTVQMSVVELDQLQFLSNPVIRVTGKIRWGIGGQQDSAEVDVLPGAMVSFPCSFVEVVARNDSFQPPVGTGPTTGFFNATVSASVGYGARAPTGLPGAFRTVEYVGSSTVASLVGGGTPGITVKRPIPRWATSGVVVFLPSSANVIIVVFNTNDVIYTVNAASGDTFPLVSPAFQVAVLNTVGADPLTALSIQYALVI